MHTKTFSTWVYILYTMHLVYSNIRQQLFVYDVDTASPTTEFPVSRYTRLSKYNGTPLARNNQRGVVIVVELELKLEEVLCVNRDKNNHLKKITVQEFYEVLETIRLVRCNLSN